MGAFVTVLREPWRRMVTEFEKPDHIREAMALLTGMKRGDTGHNASSRFRTSFSFWQQGEPALKALYFDNYYVRVLLGSADATRLPWGSLTSGHLCVARARLGSFALVIPLEELSNALPALMRALGERFDLTEEALEWLRRSNLRRAPRVDEVP